MFIQPTIHINTTTTQQQEQCYHFAVDDDLRVGYLQPHMTSREFITEEYLDDSSWTLTNMNIWLKRQSLSVDNKSILIQAKRMIGLNPQLIGYVKVIGEPLNQLLIGIDRTIEDLNNSIATIHVTRYHFKIDAIEGSVYVDVVYNDTIENCSSFKLIHFISLLGIWRSYNQECKCTTSSTTPE
ncbi:hypothetical protein DFA_06485 [Cavenderia fasciculata]|uniref:Uncharacterized protein n=1 Tax=Cavenderia fasciculata TaxID=261658 RepID=F4PJ49_CACFS|nr:uncharacterized protein DFA_06485 [Cavenderia fasciculata]EGG24335.1 hypothetical protein DFA_06485 [Cavenderia fasciculata]|eukprot:XP_004362186.1 hypothetical protein DFA_06485 [Cavenderia fasciculata]